MSLQVNCLHRHSSFVIEVNVACRDFGLLLHPRLTLHAAFPGRAQA
jgi:hypothetical protein